MPYIVTTKQPDVLAGQDVTFESRRAVATLEEARETAYRAVPVDGDGDVLTRNESAALNLPESGGTVGPLSDGIVIEVEQMRWYELAEGSPDLPAAAEYGAQWAKEQILDAYNARQS